MKNKFRKLYDFLIEKCKHRAEFIYQQVALVAMGEHGESLHDDTCSFISTPNFVDDPRIAKTCYDRWTYGDSGYRNLGSFQISLFQAYQRADLGNKHILEAVYPDWFVKDTQD